MINEHVTIPLFVGLLVLITAVRQRQRASNQKGGVAVLASYLGAATYASSIVAGYLDSFGGNWYLSLFVIATLFSLVGLLLLHKSGPSNGVSD